MKFIPSGSKILDLALGGGWARGRIANIIGDKSTGKTLQCIEAAAQFKLTVPKGMIRYREAESAFDDAYAEALGFPVDSVDFGKPLETVEDLFEDLQKVIAEAKVPELYIVDSLDALSDRSEMERDLDEGTYGTGKAKQMSQLFRRLVQPLAKKDITLMIVSQVRDNIGNMFVKVKRSGGRALDFYASQVAMLANLGKRSQTISHIERPVALQIRTLIEKNKVALPYREAKFEILFGYGIDDIGSCLDWLKEAQSLKCVGMPDGGKEATTAINKHLNKMDDMALAEYKAECARIHAAVEKRWYEIEQGFLPRRSKYGDLNG